MSAICQQKYMALTDNSPVSQLFFSLAVSTQTTNVY